MISQMPSLTSLIARETGPAAFKMAGVTHDDFDLVMIYDSFTVHGDAYAGEPGLLRPR